MGSYGRGPIVMDERPDVRPKLLRKLGKKLVIRRKNEPRAAVENLLGDLFTGERDMDRHMDHTRQVHCQVRDDPLVAIFRNVSDAVARVNSRRVDHARQKLGFVGHFMPSAPMQLARANVAECGLAAACRDGRSKKSGNCFRELVAHAAHDR